MKNTKTYNLVLTAMLTAVGLILPYITAHAFGMQGTILLPMHLPVFLIGFLCGPQYGAIGGIIIPVLSCALTGMPPVYPVLPFMTGELFTYGLVSGLLYKKAKLSIYPSMLIAMICGRITFGLVFAGLMGINIGAVMAVKGAVITGLPGIIIQLILVPIIVVAVKKYFNIEGSVPKKECDTLNHAKQMIKEEKATCIIIKDNTIIYKASGRGVKPLIELYENNPDILKDAFVVDKVIGKAAAMIAVLGGATKVYGVLMSSAAQTYLNNHTIPNDCGRCVEIISNRTGDGMCPLETAVMDTDDPEQAYKLLKETIQRLMKAI